MVAIILYIEYFNFLAVTIFLFDGATNVDMGNSNCQQMMFLLWIIKYLYDCSCMKAEMIFCINEFKLAEWNNQKQTKR